MPAPKPDPILVVTIDRLPAWILPAYGASWVAMPAANRLAARGVVFDGLVAPSDDPQTTARDLLGSLADGGRRRVAIVTDDDGMAVIAVGAEVTHVPPTLPPRQAADEESTNLVRLFRAAAGVVARRQHDVVWCHAGSLGLSWDAPESFREAYLDPEDPPPPAGAAVPDLTVSADTDPDLVMGLRHVFAGQLTLLDRGLARLLEACGEQTVILVAGLRGMPLGLHGRVGPGSIDPYGELVRLPACLVDRAGRMAGQRHGGLTIPADLGATLAEMASAGDGGAGDAAEPLEHEAAAGDPRQGRSLASLFAEWRTAGRDRVIVNGTRGGTAVLTPFWHLVRSVHGDQPRHRLFTKPDDFFELCDLADRGAAVIDDLGPLAEAAASGAIERAWTTPLGAGARPGE